MTGNQKLNKALRQVAEGKGGTTFLQSTYPFGVQKEEGDWQTHLVTKRGNGDIVIANNSMPQEERQATGGIRVNQM